MNNQDVVYLLCLLTCIGIGSFTRKIKDENVRKLVNTAIGLLVVLIVSGIHIVHCLFSFSLGAAVLVFAHASKCHLFGFTVMFGYLVFFRLIGRFGIPDAPGPTNMIQMMMTLKIAGVLFEKNAAFKKIQQRKKEIAELNEPSTSQCSKPEAPIKLTEYDIELQDLTIIEMFHYTFNYIGVLTGPYYRYRTYRDYFETPFKDYAPNMVVTLNKLKYVVLYGGMYLLSDYIWPIDYASSKEFLEDRSIFYRIMYVWPTFFTFRMRIYTGLTLGDCVCTAAGFGAYPDEADVASGEGPKNKYLHLKRNPEKHSYNFTTIVNVRVYETEICFTCREAMKHWNICIQYWLAVNIYKLFPHKKYRTFVTLLVSAFWHGFRPGHYFCIMGVPFYIYIEDTWNNLIRKNSTGTKRIIVDRIFWVFKFYSFGYMAISFLLLKFERLWLYYSSIYHFGYVLWATLFALGVVITKHKKPNRKQASKSETKDK